MGRVNAALAAMLGERAASALLGSLRRVAEHTGGLEAMEGRKLKPPG